MNAKERQQELSEQLAQLNTAYDFIGLCIQACNEPDTLMQLSKEAGQHKRQIDKLELQANWIEKVDRKPIEVEAKM